MRIVEHRGHVAVHHYVVFRVKVQGLAVLQGNLDVGHLAVVVHLIVIGAARAVDGPAVGDEARLHQVDDLLSAEREGDDFVVEGVEGQDVLERHGAYRKGIETHAAGVLEAHVGARGVADGVGHQAAQRLGTVDGSGVGGHHGAEVFVAVVAVDHGLHLGVAALEVADGEQLRRHVDDLAFAEGEGAQRHKLHLGLGLGDQHAVHHLLAVLAHACVRVSAEDGVHLGELLGHGAVVLIAQVGEQEDGVAVFQRVEILGQHVGEGDEMRAAGVFRVEVGQTVFAQLDAPDDANLQAIAFEDHVGLHVGHLQAVVEGDVGAHEGELGPGEHVAQGQHTGIPLVVAEGGEVEADGVHQLIHGF